MALCFVRSQTTMDGRSPSNPHSLISSLRLNRASLTPQRPKAIQRGRQPKWHVNEEISNRAAGGSVQGALVAVVVGLFNWVT